MPSDTDRTSFIWSNWLILALAAWLFISPWVLAAPPAGAWAWNAWVVAIILGALSIAAISQIAEWEDWASLAVGAWLFFSPWIFGYVGVQSAAWNSFIVGAAVFLISIGGIVAARQSSARTVSGQ